MKTKKIPFDLEKAKAGAKIVTKNGLNVTIRAYLDDKSYNYPIEAIVKNPTGTSKDTLYYSKEGRLLSSGECDLDLLIEEEEPDYNPYKETVKSIADMVERYSELQSLEDLKDFYYNIKVKCREAIEYDKKWCKKQEEQKTSDSLEFSPDKWYLCTRGACLWLEDGINYTSFMEGVSYLGADILKCNLSFEHEYYQNYFRYWDFNDAKDGDVLCYETKDEFRIFIYEKGQVHFHCHYYNGHLTVDSYFVIPKYLLCYIHPATKEQCDLLFQRMKEAGYMWNSDKKELHKIEKVKTRRMTNQELSWWLKEHPEEHREYFYEGENHIYSNCSYTFDYADEEVEECIRIRKNGGEWQEPLIEE